MMQTIWMQGIWIRDLILQFLQDGGEFILLGIWGGLLAVLRRRFFSSVCREAALAGGEKGRMLRAMTLKFQKSYEVHVEISDRDIFVQKYLCQEKRMGITLPRWHYLPERWAGMILCVGAAEMAAMDWLGYGQALMWQRGTAALGTAAVVFGLVLLLDVDSLWEQAHVLLLDYVSNTLYPRQIHVYEGFGEEADTAEDMMVSQDKESVKKDLADMVRKNSRGKEKNVDKQANHEAQKSDEKSAPAIPLTLKKEEEKLFQEVLSDFLG